MGEREEQVTVYVGRYDSCEAHFVSVSAQENRSRPKSPMGEGARGTEEGGVGNTRLVFSSLSPCA